MQRLQYRRRPLVEQPFTPLSVPDLVMWLRADRIRELVDDDAINIWDDASRRKHDPFESVDAFAPQFKPAIVNGRPTARFDGTDHGHTIVDHADLRLGAGEDVTFLVVLSHLETLSEGHLFVHVSAGDNDTAAAGAVGFDCIAEADDRFSWRVDDDTTNVSLTSTNTRPSGFFILSTRMDRASNLEIWFAGASEGTLDVTAVGDLSVGSTNMQIGMNGLSSVFMNVDLAELVMYKRALSAAEHNHVGRYLARRYNLSWTDVP